MNNELTKPATIVNLDFQQIGGKHVNTMIAATFAAISREMLSQDKMALAFSSALSLAIDHGVPENVAREFMSQIAKVMDAGRRSNPLSKLF